MAKITPEQTAASVDLSDPKWHDDIRQVLEATQSRHTNGCGCVRCRAYHAQAARDAEIARQKDAIARLEEVAAAAEAFTTLASCPAYLQRTTAYRALCESLAALNTPKQGDTT